MHDHPNHAALTVAERIQATLGERGQLPTLFSGLGVGLWEWRRPENTFAIDPAWLARLGHQEQLLIGTYDAWIALQSADGGAQFEELAEPYLRSDENGDRFEFKTQVRDGEGRLRPLNGWALVLERATDKSATLINGGLLDLSEPCQSATTCHAREQQLHTFLNGVDDMVYFQAIDGRLGMLNQANATITGYSLEEFDANPQLWREIVHPDDVSSAETFFKEHPEGVSTHEVYYRIRRKDGQWRWIHSRMHAVRNETGRVVGYNCIDRDVTDLRVVEERLRAREADLVLAEQLAQLGTWWYDPVRQTGYWSATVNEILGRSPDAPHMTPEERLQVIHPDDRAAYQEVSRRAVKHGTPYEIELRLLRSDGSERHILSVCRPQLSADQSYYILTGIIQDLTQHKRAQQRLLESERRYRTLFDSIRDAIAVMDLKPDGSPGTFFDVNEAAIERLGYSRAEFRSLGPSDIDRAGSYSRPHEEILAQLQTQGSVLFEVTQVAKDGREIPVENHSQKLSWDGQTVVLTVSRDISERKHAQEELNRAIAALETASDAIAVGDLRGTPIYFNRATLEMFGYTAEQIRTEFNAAQLFRDETKAQRIINHVLAGDYWNENVEMLRRDGTPLYVALRASPYRDSSGAIAGLIVIHTDISAEKEREEALRRASAALEAASDGIVIATPAGNAVYINPAFVEIYGFSEAELLAPNSERLLFGDPTYPTRVRAHILTGEPWVDDVEMFAKDGRKVPTAIRAAAFHDERGELLGTVTIHTDLTERNRLEEQIRQSQKMEAVGQLAGGIAHDFNNVLTAIIGNCELLRMEVDDLSGMGPALGEAITQIEQAGKRAASLTRQLLTFSRKEMIKPEVLHVPRLLTDVHKLLAHLIREDIELTIDCAEDAGYVRLDAGQFEQIMLNLVLNARDAMPEGGKVAIVARRFELSSQRPDMGMLDPGRYVHISVIDNGMGMDDATRKRVFEPFFTTKAAGAGTGLGLASVHGIVRRAKGLATVRSALQRGTTLDIYLPAVEAAVTSDQKRRRFAAAGGSERILVCEDDSAIRGLTKGILKQHGYQVEVYANPLELLEQIGAERCHADLLLTDVVMPGLNGRQLAERLREQRPDLPVIFMSGYASDIIADLKGLAEHDVFLEKPFSSEELLARIREALAKSTGR